MSSQLFYSLSRALFLKNSRNKVPWLLFIFARVNTSHAHFQNNEMHISSESTRPAKALKQQKTVPGKPGSKSVKSQSAWFS